MTGPKGNSEFCFPIEGGEETTLQLHVNRSVIQKWTIPLDFVARRLILLKVC